MLQLVSSEDIAGVYFFLYIIEYAVVAVRYDGMAHLLESSYVVNYFRTKEGCAISKSGLLYYDSSSLGLDALHNALYGALSEVVAVRLHREPVYTNDTFLLF